MAEITIFYVESAEHHYSTTTGNLGYLSSFEFQPVNYQPNQFHNLHNVLFFVFIFILSSFI